MRAMVRRGRWARVTDESDGPARLIYPRIACYAAKPLWLPAERSRAFSRYNLRVAVDESDAGPAAVPELQTACRP